jgi:hypothetical protein
MKMLVPALWGLSLALAGGTVAAAQDAATPTMPKLLQITREYIKAGHSGTAHDRTETAFVQAMAHAKSPTHYIALNSLSGPSRALFLTPYASFDALQKDMNWVDKNASLSTELDHAMMADGDQLSSMDQALLVYSDELSYRPRPDLSHARYMEISSYHVRPGKEAEWRECVKMVKEGHQKGGTSAHWAVYSIAFGGEGGTYLVLSSHQSLDEIDTGFGPDDKKFSEALGEENGKKLEQVYGEAVDTSHHQLLSINPRQSYADEAWVKADPDFWKPKSAAVAKAAVAKPAAAAAPAASKPSSR